MLQAIAPLKHPVFKQGSKTDCDVLKAADACCEHVRSLLLNTWPCQEGNTIDGTCAGWLLHHLKEVQGMCLPTVEFCVFDEADCLFEMGFAVQLQKIMYKMHEVRQVSSFQRMYCMHVDLQK